MTKSKKILIFEAYPVFSGSQKVSLNVANILKKQGHDLTLLLADDSASIHRVKFKSTVDRIVEIKANRALTQYGNNKKWLGIGRFVFTLIFGILPYYFHLYLFFRKENFDLFYFCDPRGALLILPPATLCRGKKIMHMHGKNILPYWLAKLIITMSNEIICVSKSVLSSFPKSTKTKLIYNGIYLSEHEAKNTRASLESTHTKISLDSVKLIYVGQIKPAKGLHHLIHSMSELRAKIPTQKIPHLIILGDPHTKEESHYKDILVNESRNGGVEHLIHWVGHQENVTMWMKSCNYLVFPSVYQEKNSFPGFASNVESSEGLPTVLIEASLSNLFSISSSVTGVNEIITENKNGIIYDHSKQDALTLALQRCILEDKKFESFPNKESFSQQRFEVEILRIIES